MLPRYSRPEMAALWSDEARFGRWLRVEQAALKAAAECGLAPMEAPEALQGLAPPDPARVAELEAELRHDVIAFLEALAEKGGEEARWLHFGMTSSDLLDTATALALREASDLLLAGLERVLAALRALAEAHRETLCVGRSHGMHAEATTFGLKMLGHRSEFLRARRRLAAAREEVSTCVLSGAVGTFAHLPPEAEEAMGKALGLRPEPVSTQVVPRDRHAAWLAALALLGAAIERLSVELRHLQRSEVAEAAEPFAAKQKGSSAMPHKRNPVLAENLTGIARLLRAFLQPALEDVALWHERDISHSSVERVVLPQAAGLADFALHRLAGMLEGLEVRPERMAANLALHGAKAHSQDVLLALVGAGMVREEAYRLVQGHALAAADGPAFAERLGADPAVTEHLGAEGLAPLLDDRRALRHLAALFDRAMDDDR